MTDTPDRSVTFFEALLWNRIDEARASEDKWRGTSAKEARRQHKEVGRLYKLLEDIQEIKGWHGYKHGIGS